MNIVFLDEYSLGGIDLSRIKQLGNYTGYEKTTPGEIAERCIDADIVITNKVPLRAEAIKVLPQLKLICIAATGMNNVDLEAAAERGIEVRNAVGYSTHAVTETTIGAAIALLRQSIYYDRYVKSGEYAASDAPFHFGRPLHQLYGKRWGIIGLGAIGHKVAEVAAALGCQIAYTSTSGVERQEPYPAMPLDELLRWSDIVSIHAPLNDRTRGLVGARELALMKPSALLINVARGGIVDEQALADALDNKRLAGGSRCRRTTPCCV
jgi:lactate dehydrogenase-like 2-hydroxyacid dehydrogenase